MKHQDDNTLPEYPFDSQVSQEVIDRLVDGELDEPQRRQLLERLDNDHELCRRVLRAFLEAQVWRESFAAPLVTHAAAVVQSLQAVGRWSQTAELGHPDEARNGGQVSASRRVEKMDSGSKALAAKSRKRWNPLGVLLSVTAVAASFALAFVASWIVQSHFVLQHFQIGPLGAPAGSLASTRLQPAEAKSLQQGGQSIGESLPVEMVSVPVPVDDAGTWAPMEVPVFSSPDSGLVDVIPGGVMPQEVLESLRAQGHTVEQERKFLPVVLPDGRQSIIPVDQVRIRFVGNRTK